MPGFGHLDISDFDLIEALDTRMDEGCWLLDLETGEFRITGGDAWCDEGDLVDLDDPERFMEVVPLPSHEAFEIMADFAASLPAGEGQRSLERALRHSRPFRSFKDTFEDFPRLREAWFKFHHDRIVEAAQAWVEDNVPGARLAIHRLPGG